MLRGIPGIYALKIHPDAGLSVAAAMAIRSTLLIAAAAALLAGGCRESETGPLRVSAIGEPPRLLNPNRERLDPPSALVVEAVAQGLVRFDAAGEIEPALAQSWIVSDDGLRYTFRLRRTGWQSGGRVTAQQVVARLRAAVSPASRNPLKPLLGVVGDIVAMTDEVLEISLRSPRPYFLQLLAQPELAIVRNGGGTGPYRAAPLADGSLLLRLPAEEEEEEEAEADGRADLLLRGERSALAVARFLAGATDLVTGGTAGDLPLVRAGGVPAAAIAFDPAAGLFGLSFGTRDGMLADVEGRRALSMAVDRAAIVSALAVAGLQSRATLVPAGAEELFAPATPAWAAQPLAMRRQAARSTVARLSGGERIALRVAMPEGPGWRIVFAHLRRDWSLIGVDAVRVAPAATADLRFIDEVAPAAGAGWYLRNFTCARSRVCEPAADEALAAAFSAVPAERRALVAKANGLLTEAVAFIPIAAPVRWSLVAPRATGFRRNMFARHPLIDLVAEGS